MDIQRLKSILESLLFTSGEPIRIAKLVKICQVDKKEIEEALTRIDRDGKERQWGFGIIRKDDAAQLGTAPENAAFVSQLVTGEMNDDLSRSALETLSIIAYRGPITRSQIEVIRGVNCSYTLRGLLVRGLVERKETADVRGFLYEISFDFLKNLGIQKVNELPDWENLSKNAKIEETLQVNTRE